MVFASHIFLPCSNKMVMNAFCEIPNLSDSFFMYKCISAESRNWVGTILFSVAIDNPFLSWYHINVLIFLLPCPGGRPGRAFSLRQCVGLWLSIHAVTRFWPCWCTKYRPHVAWQFFRRFRHPVHGW